MSFDNSRILRLDLLLLLAFSISFNVTDCVVEMTKETADGREESVEVLLCCGVSVRAEECCVDFEEFAGVGLVRIKMTSLRVISTMYSE